MRRVGTYLLEGAFLWAAVCVTLILADALLDPVVVTETRYVCQPVYETRIPDVYEFHILGGR